MRKIIDLRFLFTPFATTKWVIQGVERKYYYVFGFKVMDIAL